MDSNQNASIASEQKISLNQATSMVPQLDGKRPSVSTLWRWAMQGIHGVRLEHVWIGRKIATSREALDRFFAAAAQARLAQQRNDAPGPALQSVRRPNSREREIADAQRRLASNQFLT